jgi:hypothetical protein
MLVSLLQGLIMTLHRVVQVFDVRIMLFGLFMFIIPGVITLQAPSSPVLPAANTIKKLGYSAAYSSTYSVRLYSTHTLHMTHSQHTVDNHEH